MTQLLSTPPSAKNIANGSAPKAYMVGGGIGSLAAAAFLIRDGKVPGRNITIYEAMPVLGGSLDGNGNPTKGYFISQFVEIPDDVVFTVEYSIRVAQMAVYELLGIDRKIPPILHHDDSIKVKLDAVVKAFK